ncbi:DUF5716 family protein [Puniceicoccaceae bacterium K14]|nr:DUF5716 family protein [Puniceicoccaceae bacterium K14]
MEDVSNNQIHSLGQRLGPLFNGGFFRPLARPSAPIYVDCATRLVEAALETGQLDRSEARILIREVIDRHPNVELGEDEGGLARDPKQKATQLFNKLLEAHWITERRVSLSEQTILIAPQLRLLLSALTDLAENRPEELTDFGVGLRSLCQEILADGAFDPKAMDGDALRSKLKDFLERSERALNQMHAVETLIREHETAQRQSDSAQETLKRFLDDFHAGEHMLCYDALRESGLLPRIEKARSVLDELTADPFVKERLVEGLIAHSRLDLDVAYIQSEAWLNRLASRLGSIPQIARQIDARMAEFSNLSAARYRYQTEMRGPWPEQVKAYCDQAGRAYAGKKFSDLAHEPGMLFRTVNCEVLYGRDALAPARSKRLPVSLEARAPKVNQDASKAKAALRKQTLLALTPQRASRFVNRYLPNKGDQLSSESLALQTQEELLDFLAVLTFDRAPVRRSSKLVKWRIRNERKSGCIAPERIQTDDIGKLRLERITIERIR